MRPHPLLNVFIWWWIIFVAYTGTFKIALPAYDDTVSDTRELWLESKIFGQELARFHVAYPWWCDAAVGFPLTIFLLLVIVGRVGEQGTLRVEDCTTREKIELTETLLALVSFAIAFLKGITETTTTGFLGGIIFTLWKVIMLAGNLAVLFSPVLAVILFRKPASKRRSP